jgi:hypothetical protein
MDQAVFSESQTLPLPEGERTKDDSPRAKIVKTLWIAIARVSAILATGRRVFP